MKVYLEAIRALPDEYVADGTQIMVVGDHGGLVIVVNPSLAPIMYRASTRSWEKLKFDDKGVAICEYKINL